MENSSRSYDHHQTQSQIAAFENFLKIRNNTSIVVLERQSVNEVAKGTLTHPDSRQSRVVTQVTGQQYFLNNFHDETFRKEIFIALFEGRVGIQQSDNSLAFGRNSDWLSSNKITVRVKRPPIQLHHQTSDSSFSPPQTTQNRETLRSEDRSEKLRAMPHAAELDNLDNPIAESHIGSERGQVKMENDDSGEFELTNFETISDEDYEKFLLQMHKMLDDRLSDKKSSSESSQDPKMTTQYNANRASARQTSSKAPKEVPKHSSSDLANIKSEEIAKQKEILAEAAEAKDEKAAEKKRHFIKTDVAKGEIKSAAEKQPLIVDHEINEAALNEMVKHKVVSLDEKRLLLEHAYIDKKVLQTMCNDKLLNEVAYNKIIKALED